MAKVKVTGNENAKNRFSRICSSKYGSIYVKLKSNDHRPIYRRTHFNSGYSLLL